MDGWTKGMGGLLVIIHDSIYGMVWVDWVFMGGFLSSSLCISYEAKSLQMKKERILREYFLVLENLLCNYEVIMAERLSILCVTVLAKGPELSLTPRFPHCCRRPLCLFFTGSFNSGS